MRQKEKILPKTVAAMAVLLSFFFAQGAVVVITGMEGIPSALVRGAVIWSLVLLTLAYSLIKYRGISGLGFRRMNGGAGKRMLYFAPLLIIAVSHFAAGIELTNGAAFILANGFLTLGIGMAEELYFRGILCQMWAKRGAGKAVLVSSVLFGLGHILNMAGGAGLGATVLQICFAFVYGMVMALIFLEGNSLLPCVLLHALHDFCSFISRDGSPGYNIILETLQFALLAAYFVYLFRLYKRTGGDRGENEKGTAAGRTGPAGVPPVPDFSDGLLRGMGV